MTENQPAEDPGPAPAGDTRTLPLLLLALALFGTAPVPFTALFWAFQQDNSVVLDGPLAWYSLLVLAWIPVALLLGGIALIAAFLRIRRRRRPVTPGAEREDSTDRTSES